MRKILTLVMITVVSIILVGCADRQLSDENINVLFYTGSGSSMVSTYFDVEINTLIIEPEDPERNGFRFSGWYKEIEFLNKWDFDNDKVNASLVLYAKWDSLVWPISFVLNPELGERFSSSSNVFEEFDADKDLFLPTVNRPGGSFRGWSLVPQEEYTLDLPLFTYTRHLPILDYDEFVLYPIFNNNKYMITFQPRMAGVSVPKPVTGIEYGSVINWITPLEDTNTHVFVGWFSKNGINSGDWGVEYLNGNLYAQASNTLLYAKWQEK